LERDDKEGKEESDAAQTLTKEFPIDPAHIRFVHTATA